MKLLFSTPSLPSFPRAAHKRRTAQGQTLIELLISMTILALLVGMAVPTLGRLIDNHRAKTTIYTLNSLLQRARQEAVGRGDYVTVCPSEDLQHCDKNWNGPLMVFTDSNRSETLDAGEQLLWQQAAVSGGELSYSNRRTPFVQFKPTGHGNGIAGTFRFKSDHLDVQSRRLTVIPSGRVSLKAPE